MSEQTNASEGRERGKRVQWQTQIAKVDSVISLSYTSTTQLARGTLRLRTMTMYNHSLLEHHSWRQLCVLGNAIKEGIEAMTHRTVSSYMCWLLPLSYYYNCQHTALTGTGIYTLVVYMAQFGPIQI